MNLGGNFENGITSFLNELMIPLIIFTLLIGTTNLTPLNYTIKYLSSMTYSYTLSILLNSLKPNPLIEYLDMISKSTAQIISCKLLQDQRFESDIISNSYRNYIFSCVLL